MYVKRSWDPVDVSCDGEAPAGNSVSMIYGRDLGLPYAAGRGGRFVKHS